MYPDDFLPKRFPDQTEEDEALPSQGALNLNIQKAGKVFKPNGLLVLENVDVRGISQVEDSGFAPGIGMRSQSGIPEHHLDYQRADAINPALPEQDEEDEDDQAEEDAADEEEEDEEYYEEDLPQLPISNVPIQQVED